MLRRETSKDSCKNNIFLNIFRIPISTLITHSDKLPNGRTRTNFDPLKGHKHCKRESFKTENNIGSFSKYGFKIIFSYLEVHEKHYTAEYALGQ